MAKGTPTTEQFQHFVSNIRESFWGDVYGTTRLAWQKFWEADSARGLQWLMPTSGMRSNGATIAMAITSGISSRC